MENIYQNIQNLCNDKRITIAEIEKKAGLGNGSIKKWGDGVSPSIDKVAKVANILNTTIEFLYYGKIKNKLLDTLRKMESLNAIELKCIDDMIDFYLLKKNS